MDEYIIPLHKFSVHDIFVSNKIQGSFGDVLIIDEKEIKESLHEIYEISGKFERYKKRGADNKDKIISDLIIGKIAEVSAYSVINRCGKRCSKPDMVYGIGHNDGWKDLIINNNKISIKSCWKDEYGWTFQNEDPKRCDLYCLMYIKRYHDKYFYHVGYYGSKNNLKFEDMKHSKFNSNKKAVYYNSERMDHYSENFYKYINNEYLLIGHDKWEQYYATQRKCVEGLYPIP